MSLKIYFSTENISEQGHYDVKMAIRNGIEATLLAEEFPYDAEVSVLLCDNAAIREKNREYRGKDTSTDVLSFPMFLPDELDDPMEIPVPLGDIVISLERAEEQAAELGNTPLREIAFLAVHSTLHLLGYDHETSALGEEIMCHKQRLIIGKLYPNETTEEEEE